MVLELTISAEPGVANGGWLFAILVGRKIELQIEKKILVS